MRGIHNPIACKVGPTATPEDVIALCDKLNPNNEPGRLTLVTRLGAKNIEAQLPPLLEAVKAAGKKVVWVCDPMHGNTFSEGGIKTRHLDDVVAEVQGFFAAHKKVGT